MSKHATQRWTIRNGGFVPVGSQAGEDLVLANGCLQNVRLDGTEDPEELSKSAPLGNHPNLKGETAKIFEKTFGV